MIDGARKRLNFIGVFKSSMSIGGDSTRKDPHVFCDQGLLPLDEVKPQVEMFAELMPEFRTTATLGNAANLGITRRGVA